jgi:hypothetical protein
MMMLVRCKGKQWVSVLHAMHHCCMAVARLVTPSAGACMYVVVLVHAQPGMKQHAAPR